MAAPLSTLAGLKPIEYMIANLADCAAAQQAVRRMALTLGFPDKASEEMVLAVAELSSNLIKHAGRGTLSLRPFTCEDRGGIEVEALDKGPGILDVEQSFADGYSTAGSLGYGLGTVNRLMDEVDIHSTPDCGTQIVCRRWRRPLQEDAARSAWEVSVFTRSRRGAKENGDAFIVKEWQKELLVGLIDGLGHGELAQKAASAAQCYVQDHYDQPLDKIFDGVGRACRATRGVVMALARFRFATQLSFASLGNIEVRTWSGPERLPFAMKRGFLGMERLKVHVQDFPWKPEWRFVLHTDGIRTRWQWSDFPGLERGSPQIIARKLMGELAGEQDDATVLVVKSKTS